jgi:predicted solute-binding protein
VQVNKDIKYTYDAISKSQTPNYKKTQEEISVYINTNKELTSDQKKRALNTLNSINTNNRSVIVLGANEQDVLANTWNRAYETGNEGSRENIKAAIVTSLVESTENNATVCANGVCSRILGSLVTLDKNPSVGHINTFEQIKNELFTKANTHIQKEIEKAKLSTNEKLATVGRSYEDPNIEVDPATQEMFVNKLKTAMDDLVGETAKENGFTMSTIEQLRNQLYAACS